MPVPKRKRSRARRDSRHAHKGLKVRIFTSCAQCSHPLPAHQACPECGHYKGAKVLRTKQERTQERGQIRKIKEAAKQKNAEASSNAAGE